MAHFDQILHQWVVTLPVLYMLECSRRRSRVPCRLDGDATAGGNVRIALPMMVSDEQPPLRLMVVQPLLVSRMDR